MEDFNSMNGKAVVSIKELRDFRKQCQTALNMADKMLNESNLSSKAMADYIIKGACEYYGITPTEMRKENRETGLIDRRRIVIHLLRNHTTETELEIAHAVGLRNHATVIHHVRKADMWLADSKFQNRDFKSKYEMVKSKLKL